MKDWMRSMPIEVRLAAGAAAVVVAAAVALSWDALATMARGAGIDPAVSWVYPIVVDGMLAVGIVAALVLRSAVLRRRLYVWVMIAASTGVSVLGNAAHAGAHDGAIPSLGPWAAGASAVPAFALAATLHLLILIVRAGSTSSQRRRDPDTHTDGQQQRTRRGTRTGRARSSGEGVRLRVLAMARAGEDVDVIARAVRRTPAHVEQLLAAARLQVERAS